MSWQRCSRRNFLMQGSAVLLLAGLSRSRPSLAAARTVHAKIKDLQTLTLQGDSRTYVLVRIVTADGQWGIGEAYGTPAVGVAQEIAALRPWLIGKDPLEIEVIYTELGAASSSELWGSRTDGSAHGLMRAASGIDMALWDLAGKLLRTPTSTLLGGQFREHVRLYDHAAPHDPLDKASCRDWAAKVRADPSGFTAHKINIPRTAQAWSAGHGAAADLARDPANRHLTTTELRRIGQAYENMREALGWEHDLIVHCHWNLDLPSAIALARAIADIKPMWLEDPLPVDYGADWKRLAEVTPVPILTGENLERVEEFAPFIANAAVDFVNPDLRNAGGFSEGRRIAELASAHGIPTTLHNTGSQVYTYQACQWAAAIRDFVICETVTGRGGWMDEVIRLDGSYIEKGHIRVSGLPGTGVQLNEDVVKAHLAPGQKWWGDA